MEKVTRPSGPAQSVPSVSNKTDAGGRPLRLSWIGNALEDERVLGYVLMLPAALLIVVFIAYPFGLGVWMSLTDKLVGEPGDLHDWDPIGELHQGQRS